MSLYVSCPFTYYNSCEKLDICNGVFACTIFCILIFAGGWGPATSHNSTGVCTIAPTCNTCRAQHSLSTTTRGLLKLFVMASLANISTCNDSFFVISFPLVLDSLFLLSVWFPIAVYEREGNLNHVTLQCDSHCVLGCLYRSTVIGIPHEFEGTI